MKAGDIVTPPLLCPGRVMLFPSREPGGKERNPTPLCAELTAHGKGRKGSSYSLSEWELVTEIWFSVRLMTQKSPKKPMSIQQIHSGLLSMFYILEDRQPFSRPFLCSAVSLLSEP